MSGREKALRYFGISLILLGIICNEWTLQALFAPDGRIGSAGHKIIILLFNLLFIGLGSFVIIFPHKKITAKILLLVFSILFSLVLAETYLRWYTADDGWTVKSQDSFLHHTLNKSVSGRIRWGVGKVYYYTNSLGFRDISHREILKESDSGERILFLGDSFTESVGVEYKDSFLFKLESLFHENGANVEVLNAGVASYSPFLEYRKLGQFLNLGFKTDKVVLMLDISDVSNEGTAYLGYDDNDEFKFSEEKKKTFDASPLLYSAVKELIWKERKKMQFQGNLKEANWAKYDFRITGLERCKKYILKIARLCQQYSIRFYLVIYPWPSQFYSPEQETAFVEFASSSGITLYDLFQDFLDVDNYDKYYISGDVHWNKDGHSFVAKALYRRLRSEIRGSS